MEKNPGHYFMTWTKQESALSIPLDRMDQFHFFYKKQKWLDLSSISYQASFGHKNKIITRAMNEQMKAFSLASPKHIFSLKNIVSKKLLLKAGKIHDYKCFYTQSGSEGIENALKMARQISGRPIVLSLKSSYHGATMGALSVTGDWRNKNHLLPNQWRKYLPDPQNDPNGEKLESFFQKIRPEKVAAVCLESITGGNGVFSPTKKWWNKLKKLMKKHEIKLILDEVVCAPHRTGPFFGFQNLTGVKADFIVMAKAISGGYFPIGCLLVSKKLAQHYDKNVLSCGLTNYAHPIGLSAINAVLDLVSQKEFLIKKNNNEKILSDFIKNGLNQNKVSASRRFGMLAAIDIKNKKLKQEDFLKKGIFIAVQNNRLILAPPLNIGTKLLQNGLCLLGKIIDDN